MKLTIEAFHTKDGKVLVNIWSEDGGYSGFEAPDQTVAAWHLSGKMGTMLHNARLPKSDKQVAPFLPVEIVK